MATNSPRLQPVIPDHEVLRKIGGGAYGEVWLARGVTGALRAVKVVYREDFDSVRSFEREFEGILKFEPISRDHPGLVNILHVGRSPDFSFYYYVMELGDDVSSGREISPVEYEARTLSSDIKRTPGRRLSTDHAIDCGLRLAEALRHLHGSDLAHRDVKPANVIFVNGRAKLADIGLVAARGQRTFVGTEGFVPPEGPGSGQADVYSLGKVLYEIATGKDRLDFPELPDELPAGPERKQWLALNQIICDVCEPQLSKRKISTASDLADALRRLQQGKRRRRRRRPMGAFMATLFIGGAFCVGAWQVLHNTGRGQQILKTMEDITSKATDSAKPAPPGPAEVRQVLVRIGSSPQGAEVYTSDGRRLPDPTPMAEYYGKPGDKVSFYLKLDGYRTEYTDTITLGDEPEAPPVFKRLRNFSPPKPGQRWKDQEGQVYEKYDPAGQNQPPGDYHLSTEPVDLASWQDYARDKELPAEAAESVEVQAAQGGRRRIVLATADGAKGYCEWLAEGGLDKGFLTERNEVKPVVMGDFNDAAMSERARSEGLRPFRCLVRTIPYARLEVTSYPAGAEVYVNRAGESGGASRGVTGEGGPLVIEDLPPGETTISMYLEGYKLYSDTFTLKPGETLPLNRTLQREQLKRVNMERPYENSLGMRFIPVPGAKDLMGCIWETRVRDYRAYVQAGDHRMMPVAPDFKQDDLHPIVGVSRDDAVLFCEWLTQKEQPADPDPHTPTYVYRLPNDYEWSQMAGLQEDVEATPAWRGSHIQPPLAPRFLWGTTWPPPESYANLSDEDAGAGPAAAGRVIEGYHDRFAHTAPVGSFEPFQGFYDLCGNVNEWVADNYRPNDPEPSGVLRGGAWNSYLQKNLYLSCRIPVPPDYHDDACGFRVVFAKVSEDKHAEKAPDDSQPRLPLEKPAEYPSPDHG